MRHFFSPTGKDLQNAIKNGDVEKVIRILQQRDENGNPVVNINALGGEGFENNAILYTTYWAGISVLPSEKALRIF